VIRVVQCHCTHLCASCAVVVVVAAVVVVVAAVVAVAVIAAAVVDKTLHTHTAQIIQSLMTKFHLKFNHVTICV